MIGLLLEEEKVKTKKSGSLLFWIKYRIMLQIQKFVGNVEEVQKF